MPGRPPLESGGLLPRRCAGERLPGLRRKNTGAQYKMVTILEMPVRLRQGNHCRVTPATSRKDKKLRLSAGGQHYRQSETVWRYICSNFRGV